MDQPQTKPSPLKTWLRPWPVYVLAILVTVGTIYMARNREAGTADPVLPATISLEQNIEIQFQDVIMQGRQQGVQRWVIDSERVSLSRDGRYTYFEPKPKGKFFNLKDWEAQEGEATPEAANQKMRSMNWTADKAQFDSFTEDLEIEGSAVITTDSEDVIKTERVEYRSRQKEVFMPKPVDIVTKDGTTITADALTADTDSEVFELKGNVDLVTTANEEDSL